MLSRDGLRLDEAFRYREPLVRWSVVLLGLCSCGQGSSSRTESRVIAGRSCNLGNFIREVQNGFLEDRCDEVMRVCDQRSGSHLAQVVRAGAQEFLLRKESMSLHEFSNSLDLTMRVEEQKVDQELRRGMAALANVAATAPLVGLFGTTVGILDSFRGVGMAHSTDMAMGASNPAEHLLRLRAALRDDDHARLLLYGFYDFQLTDPVAVTFSDLIGNHDLLYYDEPEFARRYYSMSRYDATGFEIARRFPLLAERGASGRRLNRCGGQFPSRGCRRRRPTRLAGLRISRYWKRRARTSL